VRTCAGRSSSGEAASGYYLQMSRVEWEPGPTQIQLFEGIHNWEASFVSYDRVAPEGRHL
jgi:hypothetical protein